jgi:hypothetical protein
LEKHAELPAAELKQIWRQKADAHKAVIAHLRAGNLERAFTRLDKLGMLLAPENRHEVLAGDYVAAVKRHQSALVISPTHAEGERLIAQIRSKLKSPGKLGSDEREFVQLKNLQWTEAQRSDAQNYRAGLVVQFHQNVSGFQRGERVTVTGREPGRVQVGRNNGESAFLPLDAAARFHVYESRTIALAAGEMIRITQNGFASDSQRLNNGDLKQVKGFTKNGGIKLTNGWVIPKDYGHVAHGYCVTSYNSQSKGVDVSAHRNGPGYAHGHGPTPPGLSVRIYDHCRRLRLPMPKPPKIFRLALTRIDPRSGSFPAWKRRNSFLLGGSIFMSESGSISVSANVVSGVMRPAK